MSNIIDFISLFIELTGNYIVDTIILSIIGMISLSVAFGVVGTIFDIFGLYDSDLMSGVHWVIRIIVFLSLSFICMAIIKLVNWLLGIQWWVYVVIAIVIIGNILLLNYLKYKKSKHKNKRQTPNIEQDLSSKQIKPYLYSLHLQNKEYERNHCPRCGGKIVKRHGPYGDFYGCENYYTLGCKYTRKLK